MNGAFTFKVMHCIAMSVGMVSICKGTNHRRKLPDTRTHKSKLMNTYFNILSIYALQDGSLTLESLKKSHQLNVQRERYGSKDETCSPHLGNKNRGRVGTTGDPVDYNVHWVSETCILADKISSVKEGKCEYTTG